MKHREELELKVRREAEYFWRTELRSVLSGDETLCRIIYITSQTK